MFQHSHYTLSSAEADGATKGVVIGVTIGVRRVHADCSSSNYLANGNFNTVQNWASWLIFIVTAEQK